MDEEQAYQEYLKQKQAKSEKPPVRDLMRQNLATEEQITRGLENAASVLSGGLSQAIPALGRGVGRAVAPFIEGGAMGAAQDEEDRLRGFLTGAATQGGITTAGRALGKAGDVAMQIGVGRKKYTPGVGTQLADEGIMGTRGMMANQVSRKLGQVGGEMSDVASEIPRVIDARKIGTELAEETTSPLTGSGAISPSARDAGTVQDMLRFAEDVKARGAETGEQALARRRAAGSSAYSAKTQDPKLSPLAQASKLEQRKYSEALKAADPRMAPLDARYAALKKAEKGLNEEASLTGLGIISRPVQTVGAAPLATAVGQVGVKGGRGLEQFLAPLTRQATIAEPQDEEEKLYQEYLRSKGR